MRKVLRKSFCFLLIISIISSFALLHGASAEDGAVLPGSVTEKNRMNAVPDSKKLYEINIPGTHDSAMAYCKNSTNNFVLITPDKLSGGSCENRREELSSRRKTLFYNNFKIIFH